MESKLKELRELIFKCEEVKKDACINEHAQIIHQDHSVEYFEQYRSLNLEDVLRALGYNIHIKVETSTVNYCEIIYQYQHPVYDEVDIIRCLWQLGKPLQDQSEECIDSLIKLLK